MRGKCSIRHKAKGKHGDVVVMTTRSSYSVLAYEQIRNVAVGVVEPGEDEGDEADEEDDEEAGAHELLQHGRVRHLHKREGDEGDESNEGDKGDEGDAGGGGDDSDDSDDCDENEENEESDERQSGNTK